MLLNFFRIFRYFHFGTHSGGSMNLKDLKQSCGEFFSRRPLMSRILKISAIRKRRILLKFQVFFKIPQRNSSLKSTKLIPIHTN